MRHSVSNKLHENDLLSSLKLKDSNFKNILNTFMCRQHTVREEGYKTNRKSFKDDTIRAVNSDKAIDLYVNHMKSNVRVCVALK